MIPEPATRLVTYLTRYVQAHAPEQSEAIARDPDYQRLLKAFDAAVLQGDPSAIKATGNAVAQRVQRLCQVTA